MDKVKAFFNKIKTMEIYNNRKLFFLVPLVVVLIMIICGLCYNFDTKKYDKFANVGVDFQGGTLLTVEFSKAGMNSGKAYDENLEMIKGVLTDNGLKAAAVQSSGDSTIIVRYLNTVTTDSGIKDYREETQLMNDLNDKVKEDVKEKTAAKYGDEISAYVTTTLIGNTSSIRLLKTALLSVGIALILMLIYIIIRFDFYSALAAIVALIHDIVIMMSFTVIFYVEIGSTLIAALITIVAYSINNTIVVFDKIRANVKPYKHSTKQYDVVEIIDGSIRSTFRRTCFTTLTTLAVIVLLAALGVASIRTFALPIIFGLIGGFYSSVFIAAPLWGVFKDWGAKLKVYINNRKYLKTKKVKGAKAQ